MALTTSRTVARLLWIIPILLFLLALNQAKVAYDLKQTWDHGTPAMASVTEYDESNRVDVTFGYLNLRVPLPDGGVLVKRKMSLPTTLLPRVADKKELAVHVRAGAPQEVVIDALMPAHWQIAAAQAAICLLGAGLLAFGTYAWNRYLKRKGDPAMRSPEDVDAPTPVA